MEIVLLFIGILIFAFGVLVTTKNWYSCIMFKIIPSLSGMYCIIYAVAALLSGHLLTNIF